MSAEQSKPRWSSPCHCDALRRATRAVTHVYDAGLSQVGLTTPQFAILRTIESQGPASISIVARRLGIDRTTLGRNLKPLEQAGFVMLAWDAEDARERNIRLTSKGRSVIRKAEPIWIGTQASIAAQLGADKLAQLRSLLADLEWVSRSQFPVDH